MCNLWEIYLRECTGNKVLSIWIVFFFFVLSKKVSELIKFRVFFKVFFSCGILGWIFFQLNFLRRTSVVDFQLYIFLGRLYSRSERQNQSANFSCLYSSVPNSYWWLNSNLKKRRKSLFGVALSGITSPFSNHVKSSAARVRLNFFLRNKLFMIYIYIYIYIHHHHHVLPLARVSLTLSRHFSLLFIAYGRSLGLHPVSSHSCCMYVRAGRPAFAWPYAGVHRSTSLWARPCFSSSILRVWFV